MKFSDIDKDEWPSMQPYLDTCLLPVTGLAGTESPDEVTRRLERLRDVMDLVEIPFRGRIVTYPAIHYTAREEAEVEVDACCFKLKETLFTQVIVITADPSLQHWHLSEADLFLCIDPDKPDFQNGEEAERISTLIQSMWKRASF